MITSSYTPCLVSTEPTLTPENITRVLKIMTDMRWDTFAAYINLPQSELRYQYASDRDCKLALPHIFISTHPAPSWELVAHALYQMGEWDDSFHRALEYLQQHFPTGTVYVQIHALACKSGDSAHVHVHCMCNRHSVYTLDSETGCKTHVRYRWESTLVIHQWAGPSVVAQLTPDSTPDRAE